MTAFTIKNFQHKALVVGPIYNKTEKFKKIQEIENNYDLIIFNGNLCYPYESISELEERIEIFNQNPKWVFNLGQYDLKVLIDSNISSKVKEWISSKSNVVIIEYKNQTSLIILGGGLTPTIGKKDLQENLEVSFISNFNNEIWHKSYGGAYGYIISNNPLTDQPPAFYNYSMQIGNYFSQNNKVYAQEVDQYGLKETILL